MSVHFISGKPGGGKTMYATYLILQELKRGKFRRHIVTNIALNLGAINEWIEREGVQLVDHEGNSVHINKCITIIQEEDLKEFYRHRGGEKLPLKENWGDLKSYSKGTKVADFTGLTDGGVFYALDEIHIAFNSRAWATTGEGVIYYLSQHRKLGDTVLLITQSVQNVDRQMRSVAQDFSYIRNMRKEKSGLFKLPGVFMRRVFLEPAGGNFRATETTMFRLNLRTAGCYDTAAGVGIQGLGAADVKEKAKGVPWWVFPIAVVLIIWGALEYAPAAILSLVKGSPPPAAPAVQVPAAGAPVPKQQQSWMADISANLASSINATGATNTYYVSNAPAESKVVKVSGYALRKDKNWWVFYTDGSSEIIPLTELYSSGKRVLVSGKQYELENGPR